MSAILIITGILLVILVMLLWLPIGLYINTRKSHYLLKYGPLVQARFVPDPREILLIHLKVLFWSQKWSILDLRTKEPRKKLKESKTKKRTHYFPMRKSAFSPSKIRRLLRSFRIREFHWELDTGNPVLNAKLYPLFYFTGLRCSGTDLNFEGRNSLVCRVENRPIRILTAWIHS